MYTLTCEQSSRKQVTIINADSFPGYELAHHLLQQRHGKDGSDAHVVCATAFRDRRDVKESMDRLQRMGAKVEEIQYDKRESIERVIKNAGCVVLIPENERDRVHTAQQVIEVLHQHEKREGGAPQLLLMSMVGADSKHGRLKEFRDIEETAHQKLRKVTTFRFNLCQQIFYHWIPLIHKEKCLPMPIKNNCKFAPIDINDVCKAIHEVICRGEHKQDVIHCHPHQSPLAVRTLQTKPVGDCYILTGPESLTPCDMVHALRRATDLQVDYKQISRKDMEKLLGYRDHDHGHRGAYEQEQKGSVTDHYHKFHQRLPDLMIETVLDFFDVVNGGKVDFVTKDLEELIGTAGKKLEGFFKENRDLIRHGYDKDCVDSCRRETAV